ncbi:MAG: hypothetical protein HY290_25640 [Planctomycetia bacterium]|nr:hypothetical protein [Planctomycetia bacterium]
MPRSLIVVLLSLTGFSGAARADGLIYRLPADGAQGRFEMEVDVTVGGQQVSTKGSVTISSVGQTTVDNEKCRWIEFKMIFKEDDQERLNLAKVLIPEKHLEKGKSPGENLIRAWVKEGDMPATEVKDLKDPRMIAIAVFLAGAAKNPTDLDKTEIDNTALGKISSAGATGDLEVEGPGGTQIVINMENRLHEKAPFGLVTANWKFELKANGQTALNGTFKLKLADINTTALSELPDKN